LDILLTIFGLPALAATVTALLIALVCRRGLPLQLGQRLLPLAAAAGFFLGYVLLPRDWAPLLPQHSWHWLPYLAIAAAVAAAAGPPPRTGTFTT
jgi:hypothetical protein